MLGKRLTTAALRRLRQKTAAAIVLQLSNTNITSAVDQHCKPDAVAAAVRKTAETTRIALVVEKYQRLLDTELRLVCAAASLMQLHAAAMSMRILT